MENVFYKIDLSKKVNLEFCLISTNELNPYKETKEVGIVISADGEQIDGSLNEESITSLIKYLSDCREYISEYNK